jgi:4-amino-4-deoxy-L-arabinose transferase-like glycosyltransferase
VPYLGSASDASVPTASSFRRLLHTPAAALVIAVAYAVVVGMFHPYRDIIEFDTDEGINLATVMMILRGFRLYAEIWNDQPPMFLYALVEWARVFGSDVATARMLVLLFAAALVFAVYEMSRIAGGHRAALAAVALLVCAGSFLQLSVSVMVGLPAIALAALSIWALAERGPGRHGAWLVLSGALMGLSLMTKPIAAFLVPVTAVWLVLDARRNGAATTGMREGAVWLGVTLLTVGTILAATIDLAHLSQLYDMLLAGRRGLTGRRFFTYLCEDWPVYALGFLGLAGRRSACDRVIDLIAVWFLLGLLLVGTHSPVWYHHLALIYVPAAILGGLTVGRLRTRGASRSLRVATVGLVVALGVNLAIGGPSGHRWLRQFRRQDRQILAALEPYRGKATSMVSSREMFAVRLGCALAPELVVTSKKRLKTKRLTAQGILDAIRRDRPDIIVVTTRWPKEVRRAVRQGLPADYRMVFEAPDERVARVFIREGLVPDGRAL